MQRLPEEDFSLKGTKPHLDGGKVTDDMLTSIPSCLDSSKLLPYPGTSFEGSNEQMRYLYVRVVKAKDLLGKDVTGSLDPYVEVRLGNCRGTTRHFEKELNPEWNQVFALSKDRIRTSVLEVILKDKDDSVGRVMFDLNEIPSSSPPDSPLASQWYTLEEKNGSKVEGELMLAVWMGTQTDEAFSESWHLDSASVSLADALLNGRSKVYLTPKMWYLGVNVIEAQDLIPGDSSRSPEVYVKAFLGNQELTTKVSMRKTINPIWNEELIFIAAEPFLEPLILSVEDRIAPNKDVVLGKCLIPLQYIDRRLDNRPICSKWYNLEKHTTVDGEKEKEIRFSSRIHMRLCFEGGYHVLDSPTGYSSDFRPAAKQLRKSSIGFVELGILNAQGLLPMKSKDGIGSTDAYCVATYGQKWVRTRTIIDTFDPQWNEQYTWEVFDLCTVITIGVFDNWNQRGANKSGGSRDSWMGKVRIRLSHLETGRVYKHSYPLLVLYPSGLKKMGEIRLAVRITCLSFVNMINMYSQTLLPKMHYIRPLHVTQLDRLRYKAIQIVWTRLSRVEPPLRREIVEYMLDVDSHIWSMRKMKVNIFRMKYVLGGLIALGKWFDQVFNWKNPIATVVIHILFLILVLYPKRILPTIFLSLSLIVVWRYRYRPRHPPFMDTHLSCAENAHPDELDEEFDTFPTSRQIDTVRIRYDRLKSVAGRVETLLGDLATQGERLQSLVNWSDPRATVVFAIFCLIAAITLCVIPFRVVALVTGFYVLRPPWFRHKLPSVLLNFFRRLPTKTDYML